MKHGRHGVRLGADGKIGGRSSAASGLFPTPSSALKAPDDAEPTQPFFTRPSIEQPYYDISRPEWRERSFAPYPLAAWAEFTFDGVPIRLGEVVQTLQRATGHGGYLRAAGGHAGDRGARGSGSAHSARSTAALFR